MQSLLVFKNISKYSYLRDIEEGHRSINKRIVLSKMTHMMSMINHVAISVETPRIDSGCSLEKGFSDFIFMNP